MRDIEQILSPFTLGLGKKQDLANLLKHLKKNDVSMDEVIEYVDDLKKTMGADARAKWEFRCPECAAPMQILPVNDRPETQTGDPTDKSVWVCPNNKCFNTIYNKQTPKKVLTGLITKE